MKLAIGLALLALLSTPAMAQHDKEFWLSTAVVAASWSADVVTTSQSFARCRTCVENGGLFNGSRSTPKIMGAWAAVDIGAVVVSYEWKQHVHNRYLHPLWRVPLYVRVEGHTQAAFHNSQN